MTDDDLRPVTFDRFLQLLGRLNYAWTNTESLLIHLIAGLARTDKETAVVVFLTLNTTRARVDLVERLSKLDRTDADERDQVLGVTRHVLRLSGLRNRYNHCIYSFDPESGNASTILMRIADRKKDIKIGQTNVLDTAALADVEAALDELAALNTRIWTLIRERGYPA